MTHRHPEMIYERKKVVETVANPDIILEGDFGVSLACRFYPKTPVSRRKYLVVAYKETAKDDGFILTAYFSSTLSKRRKVLWKL